MDALKQKAHADGVLGESAAELFLRAKGYKIVARRYRAPVGEIDLVMLDGETLVFIEVKARAGIDEALFSITPKMQKRIWAAAEHFAAAHPEHQARPMRIDVMAVKLPFTVRHLENAWMG